MIYIAVIAFIVLSDEWIKQYIEKNVKKGEKRLICKEKIIVTKSYNEGAALRLLEKHPLLLKGISGIVLFLLFLSLLVGREEKKRGWKAAISLVLGGGLSNYIDRFARGYVIDYFTFAGKDKEIGRKIIFNLSDFCIFFGSILFAVQRGYQTFFDRANDGVDRIKNLKTLLQKIQKK